jgi:hypothetical protein
VCVDFVCHEDATCIVSSSNKAVCVCNDDLVGDGITNCSPPPKTTKPPSPSLTCKVNADCITLENSICVEGVCKCKGGFYQSSGKGQCINEDECAVGFPNDCHKDAVCTDTEGSYTCACKEGYQDVNATVKPGTNCSQINECLSPSLNDCNSETEECIDLPPPVKWQCVAPTAAPTCYDADVTLLVRVSAKSDPYNNYTDYPYYGNCKFVERFDGYCDCKGKYPYPNFPDFELELIVKGGDGCCYCESRPEERCFFLDIFS